MLKSYPLNILRYSPSDQRLGIWTHFHFSLRIVPLIIHINNFSYPLAIVQINRAPKYFPHQNPTPQTIESAPRIFNYRVLPWAVGLKTLLSLVPTCPKNRKNRGFLRSFDVWDSYDQCEHTPSQTSQTVGDFYDVIGRIASISTFNCPRRSRCQRFLR